jgi:hypothetical protein
MRKAVLVTVAGITIVAIAFGVGILVQREYQLVPLRAAEKFARDLTGLDNPVQAPPSWSDWHYPDAECKGSIEGASLQVMGELVRPPGRYAVFVTRVEFNDVARFYAEKTQFNNPDYVATSHSAVSSQGTLQGESNHLLDDARDAEQPGIKRPVRVKCLVRRCPSHDLTVLISRGDAEENTHIVVLYDPKTVTGDLKP